MSAWSNVFDLEEAKNLICTPGGPNPFTVDPFLDNLRLDERQRVLDFGCGIGRNLKRIVNSKAKEVVGYDYPNMIALARRYLGYQAWKRVKWITPPITNLKGRFDLIIATLVLQHIPEIELRQILHYLQGALDGVFYVRSRAYIDDGKLPLWPIVLDYFQPITPLDLERAKEEDHQNVIFICRS